MKLRIDEVYDDSFKKFLSSKSEIENVEINVEKFFSNINIKHNETADSLMIYRYIKEYDKNEFSTILEFDKESTFKCKKIEYTIDDICCEYCYKNLMKALFENENVKSAFSDFDFMRITFEVKLILECDEKYDEENLKKFIKDNI